MKLLVFFTVKFKFPDEKKLHIPPSRLFFIPTYFSLVFFIVVMLWITIAGNLAITFNKESLVKQRNTINATLFNEAGAIKIMLGVRSV